MQQFRPRRVIAYARVSGQFQGDHGTSLEAQREAFDRLCREQGHPSPIVFVEVEGGGHEKQEKRVEQQRLMREVRVGDLVICAKQDRWSRHTLYYLQSTEEILRRGARFFSIAERFDPSTPEGKFAAGVMAQVAELEHARIRDRTVGARQRLRAMGHYVEGTPPLGYKRKREGRTLEIDPNEADVVREMFDACISGMSTRQITLHLRNRFPNTRGGIDPAAIARKLRDRRYLGVIRPSARKGVRPTPEDTWIPSHPAIVDEVTWHRAQKALSSKRRGRPVGAESSTTGFLLRGLVLCGTCGSTLISHAPQAGGSTKHGGWYVCRKRAGSMREYVACDGPFVRHDELDALVAGEMKDRLGDWIRELSAPAKAKPAPDAPPDFERAKADLLRQQSNLVNRIADGTIKAAIAQAKLDEIAGRIAAVEDQRLAHETALAAPRAPSARREQLATLRALADAWDRLSVADKRRAIAIRMEAVVVFRVDVKKWARTGRWRHETRWKKLV